MSCVLGLDIGGANLKAADAGRRAVSRNFDLWRDPGGLSRRLAGLIDEFPPASLLALTMTAELADCFETRAAGVGFVLDAVAEAARGAAVRVWQIGAGFVGPAEARKLPIQTAAANWHALATFAGRFAPQQSALLIDAGSTTTDIIPLQAGAPAAVGATDCERLISGELVYTGVRRTPICAVAPSVLIRGATCPVAAELFATMLDVHLLLGQIEADPENCQTANGKPATVAGAHDRLARMLCCDRTDLSLANARNLATQLAQAQRMQILQALMQVLAARREPPDAVVVSGEGAFLATQIVHRTPALRDLPLIDLTARLSPEMSRAACAHAVAVLAAERYDALINA